LLLGRRISHARQPDAGAYKGKTQRRPDPPRCLARTGFALGRHRPSAAQAAARHVAKQLEQPSSNADHAARPGAGSAFVSSPFALRKNVLSLCERRQ
jgi:hypothetical protein